VRYPDDSTGDQRLRNAAGLIQRQHPHWLVMYGPYSRKIWAYPRFDVPPGTLLAGDDPSGLDAQMSEIEMTCLRRMPWQDAP
jgi:hypothetical protein